MRWPTTSRRATSRAASRNGRAPRASTARARGGLGSPLPTRFPDPEALRLVTHVNGEVRQDSTTADLVFGPQAVVDFIAETCTLEPGDVIRIEIEGLGAIEHAVQ
jgi:2-keto-4-pentenoate hydratase/2-oxohepta-3-ene-1,7-dioic acid hydratase in catechol pathway